tara:strand:- start:10216 stop:10533 length:318 start_codon:yes stop_codon:yes gene_type:complete
MPLKQSSKNNSNTLTINLNLIYSLFFLSLIGLIFFYIINVTNKIVDLKTNSIPLVLQNINNIEAQKVIYYKNRDQLLRNHIKNEAKNFGMIKADYSSSIINWQLK